MADKKVLVGPGLSGQLLVKACYRLSDSFYFLASPWHYIKKVA